MFSRSKPLPYFNPQLGKATLDAATLSEVVRTQLERWQEEHDVLTMDMKSRDALRASLDSFAQQMGLNGDDLGVFRDIQTTLGTSQRRKLQVVSSALSDLTKIQEQGIDNLTALLQRVKDTHEQRHNLAVRRIKDDVKLRLITMEIREVEKDFYNHLNVCRQRITSAVLKHIQRYSKMIVSELGNNDKKLKYKMQDIIMLEERMNDELKGTFEREGEEPLFEEPVGATLPRFHPPPEPLKYEGEGVLTKIDKVTFKGKHNQTVGCLFLTNYRGIFLPYLEKKYPSLKCPWYQTETSLNRAKSWFELPWMSVARVEKTQGGNLNFVTNDLVHCKLSFVHCEMEPSVALKHIEPLLWPKLGTSGQIDVRQYFAYWHRKKSSVAKSDWFNWAEEYKRLDIPDKKSWVTFRNTNFELSPTYPELLVVPMPMYSHQISTVAKFRSKKRFPVLTWRILPQNLGRMTRLMQLESGEAIESKRSDKPFTFIDRTPAMLRCAQPHTGFSQRCEVEEAMLTWVGLHTSPYNAAKNLAIYDCRPKLNAMANVCKGGGWESEDYYKSAKLEFLNIPNIHVIRESFLGLRNLFTKLRNNKMFNPLERYQPILDSLRSRRESWFEHLSLIMSGSTKVVETMTVEYKSVLVHCSDGWDRTAQVSSLAQLQMDPHYRTLEGFAKLVEKEWIGFGHMFAKRNGTGANRTNPGDKNRSPIFLQWLDCVYQLVQQFPACFEFNGELLTFVADSVNSCLYGNFLFDTERERVEEGVRGSTCSLWPAAFRNKGFYNPFYIGEERDNFILIPTSNPGILRLFLPFYSRWDPFAPTRTISMGNDSMQPVPTSIDEKMDRRRARVSVSLSSIIRRQSTSRIQRPSGGGNRRYSTHSNSVTASSARLRSVAIDHHENKHDDPPPRKVAFLPKSAVQTRTKKPRPPKTPPPNQNHEVRGLKMRSFETKSRAKIPRPPKTPPPNQNVGKSPPPPPPERRKKPPNPVTSPYRAVAVRSKNKAPTPPLIPLGSMPSLHSKSMKDLHTPASPPPLLSRSMKDLSAELRPFLAQRRASKSTTKRRASTTK
mmetsp:Transcript_28508/g.69517  ORF Transcript_28508/g.69517 Transcript_28508/m.69517 type:complete len:1059 (+) Transcript_28508:158-3334(+)|eukprot:CAMPEP_0114522002 /NCGR_PEP_ID=MMETSP0109-20121206/20512_1 /TAXON_ID=29199 /ORGANISM="Chlorarachnion reptans, Strain CCCM449" /LENGTH=1058 /DNA_ID=CAMNT_0001703195 /DNA_START=279 /DNA_END=3455 /DNA_ORIENTATION=-